LPNTIKIRTGSGAPSAASFATSEPAWDATNSVLYIKNATGTMVQIGGSGGGGSSSPTRTVQSLGNLGSIWYASLVPSDTYNGILTCTLVGNVDFALPAPTAASSFLCIFKQDATGNRVITFSSTITWASGAFPILPRAANTFVAIQFVCDGSRWYGWVVAQPPEAISPLMTW
jgi:hypothetical protein